MARKQSRSSLKRLLITSGAIFTIFLLIVVLGRAMGWIGGEYEGTEVETSTVDTRTITQLVTASGRIQPEIEVMLAPDVSGEIIELSIKEGDFVEEGDLLLRIRPDLFEARIDELQANLMNQKARREQSLASMLQSEVAYNKQKQLYEREVIPEIEYINALRNYEAEQANYNASRYMVENAQAQMRRAEEELRQTVIRAPMTGTISQLNVERGERVVGSVQMAGTELLRIARMEQMEVQIDVNENDIVNVKANDIARIQVDAYPNEMFDGTVTEIANSPNIRGEGTTEQITEYPVKIRIHTPHNLGNVDGNTLMVPEGEVRIPEIIPNFKPGMTATVDIETQKAEQVASIPIQAVTVRDAGSFLTETSEEGTSGNVMEEASDTAEIEHDEGEQPAFTSGDLKRVVFVVNEGRAKMVEVETGISDDMYIHLKSGANPGDVVITGSYRVLTRVLNDGDLVRVNDNIPPAIANR